MPQYLGEKAKRIAEAAQREAAAMMALQTAEAHRVPELVQELQDARAEKERAKTAPEETFICAWCRDGGEKDGRFHSKARLVLEVTAAFLFDKAGEQILEHKSREKPVYLVACRGCNRGLGLIDHLME